MEANVTKEKFITHKSHLMTVIDSTEPQNLVKALESGEKRLEF